MRKKRGEGDEKKDENKEENEQVENWQMGAEPPFVGAMLP